MVKKIKDEDIETSEDKKLSKDSVIVSWKGKSREYSKKVHGDNFMDLAKSFASKFDGEIK